LALKFISLDGIFVVWYGMKKFMRKVDRNNIITNLFFVGLAIGLDSVPLIAAESYARALQNVRCPS
jgi:hypothetical protein